MTIVSYDRQPWFTRADVGVEDDPVRDHLLLRQDSSQAVN
jgi:hypothetical protein